MSQNTLLKTASPQPLLSLNIRNVNHLFPGFTIGDFAAIYGSPSVLSLTALILKKLKEEVKNCNAKLAIISDIAGFFLDRNVPKDEAYRIYNQITKYLSNFAKENQIVLVVTYPLHQEKRRNNFLRALTCLRANTVMSIRQTKYDCEVVLEKHPQYISGVAEFPFENLTLTDFIEA